MSNPAYHTLPHPANQTSSRFAYQSQDPTHQLPPRKKCVRPSVNVSQHASSSSSSSLLRYKLADADVTEVGVLKSETRSPRRSWLWHTISHLISLLWLAPIAMLLVLNYKRHIIGASVWCPLGICSANVFDGPTDYIKRANKLDRHDHNALGALQFAAKALEIWFMLVATALIYDFAMVFAQRGGGLPLGYLLTYLEFGDVRNLFNRLMWTSPIPHAGSLSAPQRVRTFTLYLFAILAAFLTILTNLMGPATAVLVLPTLQWIDTSHKADHIFNGTGAADWPGGDGNPFPGCDNNTLTAGSFSCNLATFGPSLDAWATSAAANVKQYFESSNSVQVNLGVSQEGAFDFTLNISRLAWVPNRQVLNELSKDFRELKEDVSLGSRATMYNNSLTILLQRIGPSIGVGWTFHTGNWTVHTINDEKEVNCFTGWTIDSKNFYTKCIQSGPGWSNANQLTKFSLGNTIPGQEITTVISAFSEKSVYYNDTHDFGSGIGSCLASNKLTDCDWDQIFDNEPPQDMRNTSVNVGITVYSSQGPNSNVVWCDQIAYLGFPTYQIDLSPSFAPRQINLVHLNNIISVPLNCSPLVVSPYWFLAALSVDVGGTVDGSRPIVKELSRIIPDLLTTPLISTENLTESQIEFFTLHTYALGQAMSMVNYHVVSAATADPFVVDVDHPYLYHFCTLRVWAWGLNGRTSWLGVVVVLAGSVCVLFRLVLGLATPRHEHSVVELFAAALEHKHQQEFRGLHHENDWAKVRYRMKVEHHEKPTFHPDRSYCGSPQMR